MPTSRAFWFWVASLLFYFFANQTQIGWLYVVSALVFGALLAAWWGNRRALRGLRVERHLALRDAYHEDEALSITLSLHNPRRGAAPFVQLHEACPLVPASASERDLRLLFAMLPPGRTDYEYSVTLDRRGAFHFPPLLLSCRAPFGLFERKRPYAVETRLLVYPMLRPLARFSLLDQQPASQWTSARVGAGSEVIGVRDYRPGDALRHLHWRSIARRGQLVSKEFADDSQPGLSLLLDRFCPLALPDSKHNPFEWQVKVCVSIAEYAFRRRWPVSLFFAGDDLAMPRGPLSWDGLLQILARITPLPSDALGDLLAHQAFSGALAIVSAWPSAAALDPLLAIGRRGLRAQLIWVDPSSFVGLEGGAEQGVASALQGAGLGLRRIAWGQDWAEVLAR